MPRLALPRIVITTLLLLAFTAPFAQAEEPASPGARGTAGLLSLADLLGRAWDELLNLWPTNGCILDPHGGCATAPALDNGCGLDPHGGCQPGS
ncbi:MAG TPA: hypothetical protein VEW48_12730 [Thermoanaerobaculia bacterium]|nr:hypothetical protein [Thermoanaerobaculia bacterium]